MKITVATTGLKVAPFLVIGSGIAGLYTALKLAEIAEVTLVTKETLKESNTTYAQGGVAVALSASDSPDLHYTDTIKAGAGLCLPAAVDVLVNEGPERVKELIAMGVPFDTEAGALVTTREAAHSRPRVLHA
ncbi:MAG TPA: L-aspartate oxidase, partial [Firmicutes bacterium]|nr:L-aspartate oxidase [Bacillota bacterium]